eukprot:TRINITY_DN4470_c0_g1_i1.p1 TRINITY_DN4470_c0_g1~~TRINITY_DN4470_c0_g1_i1.p1  ORF type:complete len:118 (+),score=13.23 TRINITY_DN4470_c0_g1_i1:127-480(+)
MSQPGKLRYWGCRGRVDPIRVLMESTDFPYEYIQNPFSPQWKEDKKNFTFGTLPYFENDEVKLNQSMSILRYVARKTSTYGSSDAETAMIDQILDGCYDWLNDMKPYIYANNFVRFP